MLNRFCANGSKQDQLSNREAIQLSIAEWEQACWEAVEECRRQAELEIFEAQGDFGDYFLPEIDEVENQDGYDAEGMYISSRAS